MRMCPPAAIVTQAGRAADDICVTASSSNRNARVTGPSAPGAQTGLHRITTHDSPPPRPRRNAMNKSIRTLALPLLLAGAAFAASSAQAIPRTHDAAYYGTLDTGAGPNAGRTVVIDDKTRFVNVADGDTVRFQVGGQSFTFTFRSEERRVGKVLN